jgi:hypothetical protein
MTAVAIWTVFQGGRLNGGRGTIGRLKMLSENMPAVAAVQGLRDQLKARLDQNEDFRAWQALERVMRELQPRNIRSVSVRGGVLVEPRSVPSASVVAHVEEPCAAAADEEPRRASAVAIGADAAHEELDNAPAAAAQEKVNFPGRVGLRSAFF